ncbi:PucR family transcriptional regulator [Nocardia gipuzkoensis]
MQDLCGRVGPGPTGWAVELGQAMSRRIIVEVPELGIDGIIEMVRAGCEAVALEAVAAFADAQDFTVAAAPEALIGPGEVVSRGIGVEHMLRSIQVGHSFAAQQAFDAVESLVPARDRTAEMRRVYELLFALSDRLATAMAREYGNAREVWLASSAAIRMEIVQEILRGDPVPVERAVRLLSYDLTRHHLALIVWTDDYTSIATQRLEQTAADVLQDCGCTSTLVMPVGMRRVWAWGSTVRRSPALPEATRARIEPGIHVAMGLPGNGVAGFISSHRQALDAARVGMISPSKRSLAEYGELDLVAMLSSDLDQAREFVQRELGALADPADATATIRTTLKCYLDVERSLSAAAAQLHVARNTVAYRVQRAEQLRGRKIQDRRMQLQAALALAEELDAVVLDPPTS